MKSGGNGIGRKLLVGWMAIAARFGAVQTVMVLALFYGLMIGPMGLAMGLARWDPLEKRKLRAEGSAWHDADSAKPDLERAKLLS